LENNQTIAQRKGADTFNVDGGAVLSNAPVCQWRSPVMLCDHAAWFNNLESCDSDGTGTFRRMWSDGLHLFPPSFRMLHRDWFLSAHAWLGRR